MPKSLLYSNQIDITDKIKVNIPSIGEVIDNEDEYYNSVALITATPFEMMAQLDDVGIDFEAINDFELFYLLFSEIQRMNSPLVFKDLDLTKFKLDTNEKNNEIVLRDNSTGAAIDKSIHYKICKALSQINFIEKSNKRPANAEAKKFLLERAHIKQKRAGRKPSKSQLEELIIAMVNTKEFPYDFDGVRKLSIFQFNASVRQIIKKINYDNLMIGCYAGTINTKELNPEQLNWLSSK